ncbi:hypothetical protein KIL84_018594 [Mauremys mutica]|uniref:Uncharacterized protein n=1 Tax=Mauremys mutica TaxID=74926 RepID=A0A9D3XVA4_9SAUR|nr:hypothetical protein KIL84_018594 [Mauremys mutica]
MERKGHPTRADGYNTLNKESEGSSISSAWRWRLAATLFKSSWWPLKSSCGMEGGGAAITSSGWGEEMLWVSAGTEDPPPGRTPGTVPRTSIPPTPLSRVWRGRPMVLPKLWPPSELPLGAAPEATVPTGTTGPATMLGATATAVAPAARVGRSGPKDGYKWRPGWCRIRYCLLTGRNGGARICDNHGSAISTWRTGTNSNGWSANGLDRRTLDSEATAIDTRGCSALAETWRRSPSGNGIDDRATTDCGTLPGTRTDNDIRHSPIDIRSLRRISAASLVRTEPSPRVWSVLRAIHVDSVPSGPWAVISIGNIPSTETGTKPGVTAEIPVEICLWSMGPTSVALQAPAWTRRPGPLEGFKRGQHPDIWRGLFRRGRATPLYVSQRPRAW